MLKIQPIIDYIENTYDFEFVPCAIPRNEYQYSKRNFYLYIKGKSEKLFYFLRDKVSPIKYLKERPDGSLSYQKRGEDGRISVELIIEPCPPEVFIYVTDTTKTFQISLEDQNYKFKLYNGGNITTFPFNYNCGEQMIDNHFTKINELKSKLRNHKLNILL